MKLFLFCAAVLLAPCALAADDEAALKAEMQKVCAPLFAPGGPCAQLAKGTRKCVRQNLSKGGAACADFEKAHTAFFDAGMKDEIVHK
jgi:hypothetical protein